MFYSKLLHELFGPDYSIIISKVEHLDPSFNANVITKMFMTLEEIAGANRHNLGTFLKGLFDRTQKKTHKQKYFEDTEIDTYFKAVFITNEQFVHLTSKEERRWWFWRVEDNGWIDEQWRRTGPYSEGKRECFGSRADYFTYLAGINPFFWANHLLSQDIENFNAQRDAPKTEATVAQKELSLSKTDPVLAFWHQLADDERSPTKDQALLTASQTKWKSSWTRKMETARNSRK